MFSKIENNINTHKVVKHIRIVSYMICIMVCISIVLGSCTAKKESAMTPWGTMTGDTVVAKNNRFSLNDIINNGEMIVLTLSGPETYYDYHGHGMGEQYLLCEKFAQQIGVSIRVDLCKDTTEMVRKLINGDGDMIAFPLPKDVKDANKLSYCGMHVDSLKVGWAVLSNNEELASALNKWYKPGMIKQVKDEESYLLSTRSIRRHVYAPLLNGAKGEISRYDSYFKQYASAARVDWRMMAAQCYQESCFDPNARSWAGACGLMQIMPTTAAHLGLPQSYMFNPEANIAASAKFMSELGNMFRDVPDYNERMNFILACYNGGYFHIRDAMALASKYGHNKYRWDDVSQYVLLLTNPRFYRDPVVKHGYMRGTETVDYVNRIRTRYYQYCGVAAPCSFGMNQIPHRSTHKHRFKIR